MRTIPIKFLEKDYTLCFSVGVMMRMEDENLSLDTVRGSATVLSAMMEAGDAYEKAQGKPGHGFLTVEQIAVSADSDDISATIPEILKAMNIQAQRKVETAESQKNAGAASPDA